MLVQDNGQLYIFPRVKLIAQALLHYFLKLVFPVRENGMVEALLFFTSHLSVVFELLK